MDRGRLCALKLSLAGPPESRQALLDYQDVQLRRLVSYSYHHVPFYRKLLSDSAINPDSFRGLEDLQQIPITSKRDLLREPTENLVSRSTDPATLVHHRTNGSTGEPFIVRRSRFEDILLSCDCSCGSTSSSIKKVKGRILDRIILPGGQLLSPDRLFFVIEEEAGWARQYQVRQPRRDLVQLQLVPCRDPGVTELARLRIALRAVVGEGLEIEVKTVPSIAVGPGGKMRLSHSEILAEYLETKCYLRNGSRTQ